MNYLFSLLNKAREGNASYFINFFGNLYLAFWNWGFCFIPSYTLRHIILKYIYGVRMGKFVNIHMAVKFLKPWNIIIGDNVNIQMGCFIDGRGGLVIENNVDITIGVKVLTQQHDIQSPSYLTVSKQVVIKSGSVLGSFSLIMPGIVVGEGAVIAAGSVVSKNVGDWTMVAGNPAVKKRQRSSEQLYKANFRRPFH